MPVIAFAHHKGGTGKTTSCLNIAGALNKQNKKVLVIDCDPQGNATAGLGLDTKNLNMAMDDIFLGATEEYDDVNIASIIKRTKSGIYLAPSSLDLVGAEPFLYGIEDRTSVLKKAIEPIKSRYDYILIDTPPSMGQFVINGIVASDRVIVTLDTGDFALQGINTLNEIFRDIDKNTGKKVIADIAILTRLTPKEEHEEKEVSFLESLMNRLFGKTEEEPEINPEFERQDRIISKVKKKFETVFEIPYSTEIFESQKAGKPVSHYSPECEAAKKYSEIAEYLTKE